MTPSQVPMIFDSSVSSTPTSPSRPLPHGDLLRRVEIAKGGPPLRHAATLEPSANRLLAALPPAEWAALAPRLERVSLRVEQTLHRPGAKIEHLYFPDGALVALSFDAGDEPVTVGRDGLVGVSAALGQALSPAAAVVRIPGSALRLSVGALGPAQAHLPVLWSLLQGHVHACLLQLARTASCARAHLAVPRVATLLLRLREQTGSDLLPLTHVRIARLAGVSRRASVTDALAALRARGAIDVRRRGVTVRDADGLRALGCPCLTGARADGWTLAAPLGAVVPSPAERTA